jgi:hypothetical protein
VGCLHTQHIRGAILKLRGTNIQKSVFYFSLSLLILIVVYGNIKVRNLNAVAEVPKMEPASAWQDPETRPILVSLKDDRSDLEKAVSTNLRVGMSRPDTVAALSCLGFARGVPIFSRNQVVEHFPASDRRIVVRVRYDHDGLREWSMPLPGNTR